MAEAILVLGVIGSVVGIAAEGVKLSQTLNTYIENVRYAEKEIKLMAREVKGTAIILAQFEENLKLEQTITGMVPSSAEELRYICLDCLNSLMSISLQTRVLRNRFSECANMRDSVQRDQC